MCSQLSSERERIANLYLHTCVCVNVRLDMYTFVDLFGAYAKCCIYLYVDMHIAVCASLCLSILLDQCFS